MPQGPGESRRDRPLRAVEAAKGQAVLIHQAPNATSASSTSPRPTPTPATGPPSKLPADATPPRLGPDTTRGTPARPPPLATWPAASSTTSPAKEVGGREPAREHTPPERLRSGRSASAPRPIRRLSAASVRRPKVRRMSTCGRGSTRAAARGVRMAPPRAISVVLAAQTSTHRVD